MSIAAQANTLEGHNNPVIVIGGGAAGILAAISAGRSGSDVILCERMNRLGRKVLASGNGRCNLLNDRLDSSFYNPSSKHLVETAFSRFGKREILDFFLELGLHVYSDGGRIFPVTNQSSSVLKVLEMELKRLSVCVEYNFNVTGITYANGSFIVSSDSGKSLAGRSVVIACGGKSYPALGSDGSAYKIAKNLGHTIVEPVPAAVPLLAKNETCHVLQGQKICAHVKGLVDGKTVSEASGDLLFTKYGLSGTAILDISRELSVAINRHNTTDLAVRVDMAPFINRDELETEISERVKKGVAAEDLLIGILPNKFGMALKKDLISKDPASIAESLKERRFKVTGTRGWNEADFTAGGIDVKGICEKSLESKARSGLFFSGEILDVDGKRGGYNLAWAWSSGFIAGQEAAAYA